MAALLLADLAFSPDSGVAVVGEGAEVEPCADVGAWEVSAPVASDVADLVESAGCVECGGGKRVGDDP